MATRMPISEFRKLNIEQIPDVLPVVLTAEGEEIAVVSKPEDVVIISDLHPAVKKSFKNQELKVRAGMPKPDTIKAQDVK